jgi:tetratricopeptide (TPR) repeat protein
VGRSELGLFFAYIGQWSDSEIELETAFNMFLENDQTQYATIALSHRVRCLLLIERSGTTSNSKNRKLAIQFSQSALELADETTKKYRSFERDYIHVHWRLGAAYRANNDFVQAETHLDEALRRCRAINAVDNEADILLEVAKLRQTQGVGAEALRLAREALIITERSGYVLQGADVNLFLAELAEKGEKLEGEKEMSNQECALMHAKQARQLATGWEEVDGKVVYDTTGKYVYKVAYDEAGALIERLTADQ